MKSVISSKTIYLLYTGILIPVTFLATTIACGFILGDYNHLTRMVSELGALGTVTRYIFATGLILCSALSLLFFAGLYKTCKLIGFSTVPLIFILAYTFSIAGASLFPMPLRLHEILGMPSIFLILSPLLSLFLWKRANNLIMMKTFAIISLLFMSLGFLVYFPGILGNYIGLKQRLFHAGWSVWFIYLSVSFIRLLKIPGSIKPVKL